MRLYSTKHLRIWAVSTAIAICTTVTFASDEKKSYNDPVMVDNQCIKLFKSGNSHPDLRMKDQPSLNTNWATSHQMITRGYRFYYIKNPDSTSNNCNRIDNKGSIFPGTSDGSYTKDEYYKLYSTKGKKITQSAFATVCARTITVDQTGSTVYEGPWIFVGSLWLDRDSSRVTVDYIYGLTIKDDSGCS